MANGKRNILNIHNGFNVMVNLYIIRYLYSHMEKAEIFMDPDGERRKSKDFYKRIKINRQRMHRIMHGYEFEMSEENRKTLMELFNIEDTYFNANGKFVEIHLLTEKDWKLFFYHKYEIGIGEWEPQRKKKERIDKVESALKRLLKKNVVENEYEPDTAVYRIHYYWKNGVAYIEDSNLTKFIRALSKLQVADWTEIESDIEKMEQYREELLKHADYLRIVTEYKKVKKI